VERKWKNYHIITFPGQSLSKNRETQFGRDYGPVARQTNTRIPNEREYQHGGLVNL
jgi:hypothetical protein